MVDATVEEVALIEYDVVLSDSGFFISVNDELDLAGSDGWYLNEAGCVVVEQEYGEAVLKPVPEMFRKLIEEAEVVIFVRFEGGELVDAKDLRA